MSSDFAGESNDVTQTIAPGVERKNSTLFTPATSVTTSLFYAILFLC